MRMKHLITGALLLVILFITGTSSTSPDMIYWSKERKLTWDDFQGQPDYNYADVSALTSSGILHFKGCENGKIIYKVEAYFEKKQSWFKEEAHTDHHLQHEQIHFDITELYARKLRNALETKEFKCGQEEEFDSFVRNFLNKWQAAQINYDLYTHYSMRKRQQGEWKHRVAMELSVFDQFSD